MINDDNQLERRFLESPPVRESQQDDLPPGDQLVSRMEDIGLESEADDD